MLYVMPVCVLQVLPMQRSASQWLRAARWARSRLQRHLARKSVPAFLATEVGQGVEVDFQEMCGSQVFWCSLIDV